MDNLITDSTNKVFYVIKINGMEVSARFPTTISAEMAMMSLTEAEQKVAIIVPIVESGDQLLLG